MDGQKRRSLALALSFCPSYGPLRSELAIGSPSPPMSSPAWLSTATDIVGEHHTALSTCRWVQGTWAGVDRVTRALQSQPPWTLTRFAGFFGPAMVNYVMGQILAREQRVHDLHDMQAKSQWRTPDMVGCVRIFEKARGLVCGGRRHQLKTPLHAQSPFFLFYILDTTTRGCCASSASASWAWVPSVSRSQRRVSFSAWTCAASHVQSRVILSQVRQLRLAASTTPNLPRLLHTMASPHQPGASSRFSDVEYFVRPETLPSFLDGCDYVVSLLPSTEETRGFLTAEKLAPCKGQVCSSAHSGTCH